MPMTCTKKQHKDKWDAVTFQYVNNSNGQDFRVYECPECGYWHVTVHGISNKVKSEMVEAIQNDRSRHVRSISNCQRVHRVEVSIGTFEVLYNRKQKTIKILEEII